MTRGSLHDLAGLTDMLFRAEQAKLRHLAEEEAALRRDLARLDAQSRDSRALAPADLVPLRRIGADLLWQGWVGRTRADLNRQLALCLARKARMMVALRRAHGRNSAVESLLKQEDARRGQARQKHRIAQEQSLNLVKESRR